MTFKGKKGRKELCAKYMHVTFSTFDTELDNLKEPSSKYLTTIKLDIISSYLATFFVEDKPSSTPSIRFCTFLQKKTCRSIMMLKK